MDVADLAERYAEARQRVVDAVAERDADLADVQAQIDALQAQVREAKDRLEAEAVARGHAHRVESAQADVANLDKELHAAWIQEVDAVGKTLPTPKGQVQLSIHKGIDVTDARSLLHALDERRLWSVAVSKPEKIAAALDAKTIRGLCDGEDALPGVEAKDSASLSWRPAP